MAVADDEKERTAGQHDNLGVHPERREAEAREWEKRLHTPSAPPAKPAGASSVSHVPEADRAVTRPNLQVLEGGGEGDSQPTEAKSRKTKSATSEELQGAESAATGAIGASQASTETGSDVVGKGYTHTTSSGRFSSFKTKIAGSWNKKFLLGGAGAGGGIIALLLLALFALIPLKIENMVKNLEKHFFSSSENAVENESDSMFTHYVERYVAPALSRNACGTHTTKDCSVNTIGSNGKNPVTNMYRTWAQAKLENTLANKYGIEIDYNTATRQYFLKAPGITDPNGDPISSPGEGGVTPKIDDAMFQNVDRGTVRQAVKDSVQNESRLTQVLFRYKIGRLLEEKYGIKRCIVFCGTRDALADFKSEKKNAAQIYLVQRVITPRSTALGIVLECLLNPNCHPEQTNPSTEDPNNPNGETVGEPENPDTDTKVRTTLEDLAKSYGVEDDAAVQAMVDAYNDAEEKGVSSTVLAAVLDKVGLGEFTDQIENSADALGWLNQAFSLIGDVSKAGPSIKKLTYVTNSAAAVSSFMMLRTFTDEIHTGDNPGKVDATEVGSFVNSLGPGNQNSDCTPGQTTSACPSQDAEIGGTASAEQTPLYGALIDGNPSSVATTSNSSLLSLLSPKVYAASPAGATTSTQPSYLCNNGQPVPAGSTVCPEEVLGLGAKNSTGADTFLQDLSNTFNNTPVLSTITKIAGIWNSNPITKAINGILGDIFSVLGSIPGVNNLLGFIGNIFKPFVSFIEQQLIPNPFGANMSGGRTFDEAAAGADVAGNDYSHNGLGGQKLTSQQVATITNQQQNQDLEQFQKQSFFARIFDTNSEYSLVSKLAMDIPIGSAGNLMKSSFASILSDPFGKLMSGFGSIFAHKTSAATLASDPFDVTQYGYPAGTIPGDPETYWTQNNCGDTSQNGPNYLWDKAASNPYASVTDAPNIDPNTGMPVNTTTDPCMLIQATVGAAGGYFSTSNLTADDLAESGATP